MRSTASLSRRDRRFRGRAPLLLLLAACAGVGLLLTLWWFQRTRLVEGGPAGAGGRGAAALVAAPIEAQRDGPEDAHRSSNADAVGRVALTVPEQLPTAGDPGRFAVLVLEGRPPKPVAGAAVRLLALRTPESRAGRPTVPLARHRLFEPLENAESDDDGLVWFARNPKGLAVEAEADGNWGWLELAEGPPGDGPAELWLEPDRSVRVLVVDRETGQPRPGVDVQLNHFYDEGQLGEACDSAVSDGEGRAQFEHLGRYLQAYWAHTDYFAVEPAGDWSGAAPVRLDMGEHHGEVVLPVAEFTELRVRVLDGLGEPYLGGGALSVWPWVRTRDGNDWQLGDHPQVAELLLGEASFRQLAPAARVHLDARPDAGPPVKLDHVYLAGPGRTTDAVLHLPARPTRWLVRPIAADGTSLAGGKLGLRNATLDVPEDATPLAINPYLLGVEVGPPHSIPVQVRRSGLGWTGTLLVPGNLAPGDVDLGALVLEPRPIAFAGQVVDVHGKGIANAWVREFWRDSDSESGEGSRVKTDGSGNFALSQFSMVHTQAPESRRFALEVHREDYVKKLFPGLHPGTADLRLELASAGQIRGTVLIDSPWMRDFIGVVCSTDAGEFVSRAHIETRGDLVFPSLPPGMYTITFTMESEVEPAVRVTGVQVLAGEVTRDPRLQELDLRDLVGHVEVQVVDTEGAPIPSATGYLLSADVDEWGDEVTADAKGRLHFFARRARAQVFVGAHGFQSVSMPLADGGARVELDAAREMLVHWVDLPTEMPPGFAVRVSGRAFGVGQPERRHPVRVAANRESAQPQPFDGADELELTVYFNQVQPNGPPLHQALPPLRFPVSANAAQITIAVPFPAAEWAEYLARMGVR